MSEGAKGKGGFYFTPLRKTPADPKKPWFTDVPIGWNKLDRFVRDMREEVGIERKSNHSLKVTGATWLYRSGVVQRTIVQGIRASKHYEYMSGQVKERIGMPAMYQLTSVFRQQ